MDHNEFFNRARETYAKGIMQPIPGYQFYVVEGQLQGCILGAGLYPHVNMLGINPNDLEYLHGNFILSPGMDIIYPFLVTEITPEAYLEHTRVHFNSVAKINPTLAMMIQMMWDRDPVVETIDHIETVVKEILNA